MIERLAAPVSDSDLGALAGLLVDAVDSGAAVSFLAPLTPACAEAWWRSTVFAPGSAAIVLVARDAGEIVGTVQLTPAWAPNQPHRAELTKLLVQRRCRGAGLGERLMRAAEEAGRAAGFRLLTLDARRGSAADRLYRRLGWIHVGTIPRFAIDPDGAAPHDASIFYKDLAGSGEAAARAAAEMGPFALETIGVIRSPIGRVEDAPLFYTEGAPGARLELLPPYLGALHRMSVGDEIIVITWLHLARRDVLQVHPRGDASRPLTGVFSTRSPDRPNPLGLHRVRVVAMHDDGLEIGPIEAVDGTPVVDIKPVVGEAADF